MRIHPKVIAENFEKGNYIESWKGFSADYILCFYCNNFHLGEDRFKACVNKSGGPMYFDWWDLSEIAKLTEDEVNELTAICAYKTYIKKELETKDISNRLSAIFACDIYTIRSKGSPAILELCATLFQFSLSLNLPYRAKRKPLTPAEEQALNPFYFASYSEFVAKSHA
jgi:hypothetical protein